MATWTWEKALPVICICICTPVDRSSFCRSCWNCMHALKCQQQKLYLRDDTWYTDYQLMEGQQFHAQSARAVGLPLAFNSSGCRYWRGISQQPADAVPRFKVSLDLAALHYCTLFSFQDRLVAAML
jgi:hypothetical protein